MTTGEYRVFTQPSFQGTKEIPVHLRMSYELEERIAQLHEKATSRFRNFMTRVAKLEELGSVGSQFLKGFRHELEYFRRPPIPKISKVLEENIKGNNTRRMSAYVDAGYRHAYADTENTAKLSSFQQGILDHQMNVKQLIGELEGLTQECIATMQEANEITSDWFVEHFEEMNSLESYTQDEKEAHSGFQLKLQVAECHCEKIMQLVILMRVLCKMIKLDYTMQDKIVMSLNLNASLDQLDSYHLMWELRPYIEDNIVEQCWALIS